jgi:hypothetical protein
MQIVKLITKMSMFEAEHGGSGGLGSEAHGLGYSAKKVELTSFPQQPRIPQNVWMSFN